MSKKTLLVSAAVFVPVVFLLVVSNLVSIVATYYATPYIRGAPDYSLFVKEDKKEISVSEMDKKARVVVVIEDGCVIKDEKQHIDWAQKLREKKCEYERTEKHFGYTGIVLKLANPKEKPIQ